MNRQFKYRAFISYSHSDEGWAKWLHRSLETYRVPKHLVGTETAFGPVPERFAPVFRDRDQPWRHADHGTGTVGLPERDLLAGGREIALGQ